MKQSIHSILSLFIKLLVLFSFVLSPHTALALTENYTPVGIDYIFYTSLFFGVVFAAFIIIAYREYKWLSYALFAALLTLNLSAMDGTLAHLLGNSAFTLWVLPFLLHASVTCYGYIMIAYHLDDAHTLFRFKPLFFGLAIITALFPLTSFLWLKQIPLPVMWLPINILFFGMVLMQVLPPLTWRASTQLETSATKYLAITIVSITILLYATYYFSAHTMNIELKTLNRITLLLFSFGSLSIVILRLFIHNKEKEQAKHNALITAKKQAETELTLLQLEQNYQNALTTASHHQSQLSSVSHDLKQPLAVLRFMLNKLNHTEHEIDTHRLSHAVNYMDDLIQHLLATDNDPTSIAQTQIAASEPTNTKEKITTSLLAQTLEQMFQDDAKARNTQLTLNYHSVTLLIEPLLIMRLMNNLVANAIVHAYAKRILITFRKRQNHVLFQVIDNGCGMTNEQITMLSQPGHKSTQSPGQGLGLDIVQTLCQQQNITFTIKSKLNKGTCYCLQIPFGYP
jgi:signal transduction histidine kinase